MTTYTWAQLDCGDYGLPGPAMVTSPWVLEVRVRRPRWRGFTRVTHPRQWSRVRTARRLVADYSDPWDVLVASARRPADVDGDGLRTMLPGSAGSVDWLIGTVFREPGAQAFHDQVHAAGRLLLLTGDLQAHWACVDAGRAPTFAELFPGGAWATWIPLLLRRYSDGFGTRPD